MYQTDLAQPVTLTSHPPIATEPKQAPAIERAYPLAFDPHYQNFIAIIAEHLAHADPA